MLATAALSPGQPRVAPASPPALFTPLTLRQLTLKNRVAVSPMQQYSAGPDGQATDWHLVHLGSRAAGGAGLVLTEATAVTPQGRLTPADLGLWHDDQIGPLRRITDFVHSQGAAAGVQLGHGGAKGSRQAFHLGRGQLAAHEGGWELVGASAGAPFAGMTDARALTTAEMQEIVAAFGQAARRAEEAGFDAVEIHGGYGYLMHQFLSPLTNHRQDEYGGSFEHRTRLLREVVAEIRRHWPAAKPLLLRLAAQDYAEPGLPAWTLADSVQLVRALQPLGLDLVTCVGGGFFWPQPHQMGEFVQLSAAVRAATGVLTGGVGRISTAAQANAVVANGQADLVLLATQYLRDPYFALHAARELGAAVEVPFQYIRAF